MIVLRDYQEKLVNDIRAAYRDGKTAPLAVAPTGAGKTVMFAYIASGAAGFGHRSFIVCHRIELIKQACKTLRELGISYGVIHPDAPKQYGELIQVCSVQTLANRIEELVAAGIVPRFLIYDEAHHGTAGMWRRIREQLPAPATLTLGVTATPVRTDGQGLGAKSQGGVYDVLLMGPQISELIAAGYLVQPDVYAPESQVDLAGLDTADNGDFDVRELAERVDRTAVTGDAVQHYRELADGLPAAAFCVSIAHAEHVAEQFRAAGYRAFAVSGDKKVTPPKFRERVLAGLATGDTQVVCSCDLISEGTDIPALAVAILLRPTLSLGLYLQQVGRILRPIKDASGKPLKLRGIVLDHVGNSLRHGMPEENRNWTLEGIIKERKRKKADGPPAPRVFTCSKCYSVHLPAPACPKCGTVYPVPEPEPIAAPVAGKLIQITEEIKERILSGRERAIAECRTLEDLQALAKIEGYPPGWASHTWKRREKLRNPELSLA